jgi:molecular chaperone DnaJ
MKHHPDRNPGTRPRRIGSRRRPRPTRSSLIGTSARATTGTVSPASAPRRAIHSGASTGRFLRVRGHPRETFSGFSVGDLFGSQAGRPRGSGARRGADLRYDLELDLLEAAHGIEKEIRVPKTEACDDCKGTGSRGGARVACRPCGGRGQVVRQQGFFTLSQTCGACRGTGEMVKDPCPTCRW